MAAPANIILVGFMASGKTQVGKILSESLDWPMIDADDEIVRRAGKSIRSIFDDQGEAAFRDLERQVIADLCLGSKQILAAGGGAFVDPTNRELMLLRGLVFCLMATPETIYARVTEDTGKDAAVRPLLAAKNPLGRIKELLSQRTEAYAQAHHSIDTDVLTPEQVAQRILEIHRKVGAGSSDDPGV